MTGINAALNVGGFSVGSALAQLANTAASPNFELAFNGLQNTLLDRLNEKIVELNDNSLVNADVDVFIELEKKKLQRLRPLLEEYQEDTLSNYKTAGGMVDDLTTLEGLSSGGDATAFDALLAQVNSDLGLMKTVSGLAVGLNVKDGLATIQSDGLGIGSYASYGSDADRLAAVTAAKDKLSIALSVTTQNLDAVYSIQSSVGEKIISIDLQVEALLIADKAEKINAIEKLQEENSRLVQALSLAFEVNQSQAEALTQQLLIGPEYEEGTVLDLFI